MIKRADVLDDFEERNKNIVILDGLWKEWFIGLLIGSVSLFLIAHIESLLLNHLMLFPCGPIKITSQYHLDLQLLFSSCLIFLVSFSHDQMHQQNYLFYNDMLNHNTLAYHLVQKSHSLLLLDNSGPFS